MSVSVTELDIGKLNALYDLREARALEAIAEQRLEIDRFQAALDEQLALVQSLRDELSALHTMRTNVNIKNMSSQSLIAESDRRRWLTYDLDQEVFYLGGFRSDVNDAKAELSRRQSAWLRIRDRIQGIDKLAQQSKSEQRRIQTRRDDALLDSRPVLPRA